MQKRIEDYREPELEASKLEAITTTDGPLLIIAGPGAGKTRTIVERIIYLIAEKNVLPENIMVSTFTEKAAKELLTRVSNKILEMNIRINLNEMYLGTLHSIFLRILEENREKTRLKKNYRIIDTFEQRYFIFNHLSDFKGIEDPENILGDARSSRWVKAGKLLYYISKIGEEGIDANKLLSSRHPGIKTIGECKITYDRLLSEENILDFQGIQTETFILLEDYPDILEKIRDKIKYIMVDEYQDTNTIQESILLKMMHPVKKNICVVGDDDQGIYRFRGASIRNILEFEENFPAGECKKVTLTTNFRSHPDIIKFYNSWMEELDWEDNTKCFRHLKEIKPKDGDFIDNPSVIKVSSSGLAGEWHAEVLRFLNEIKDKGVLKNYNQVAFLFKSVKNRKVTELSNFLEQNGINVFSPRSALFFAREEVILLLGALIYIFPNLFDQLKWSEDAELEIWTYYEKCKRHFANLIREDMELHKSLLSWCNIKAKGHLTLTKNTDYGFASLFYQLLEFPMFSKHLDVETSESAIDLRAAYNISMFSKLLTRFESLSNFTVFTPRNIEINLRRFFNQYIKFLYDGGIEEYEDFDEYTPAGCVSFMTIHQSKGLEFPIVFVDSLNAVPRKQYTEIDVILQEEFSNSPQFEPFERTKFFDFWRLYYTAFSRPQDLLVLTGKENDGKGLSKLPSKYFAALYNEVVSWRSADFDIEKLELAKVKTVNIKREYSFTGDILLYENCPLQYKFYRDLEFSPVRVAASMFGILVHQSIEDVHKAVLRGEAAIISDEQIEHWFNKNYNGLSKKFSTYLGEGQKRAAMGQVIDYKNRNKDGWDRILEAEVDVSLVKDEYILKGTIDLVRGDNNTVDIIDFKSERHKPDVNSTEDLELLNRYKRQLEVYSHIIEERKGQKINRMHLYYTGEKSGNPYISFDRREADMKNTIKSFDSVVEKIENKLYDMTRIQKCEKLCGNCDMRFYCQYK